MNHNLHITIGSAPGELELMKHEIEMLKCSLLYADKTKLLSVTTSLFFLLLSSTQLNSKQQIEFFEQLFPLFYRDESYETIKQGIAVYKNLFHNKRHLNRNELIAKLKLESEFKNVWKQYCDKIFEMLEGFGLNNLIKPIESGLLEIIFFDTSQNTDKLTEEYLKEITKAVSDGSTYPLFDELVSDLVRTHINENLISVSDSLVARAKHVGLAAKIIERLPLFEFATIDEILDIRSELEKPLMRFRAGILKFSSHVKSASWDKDFILDVENIMIKEVEPAILDIEESIIQNQYLSMLIRRMTTKPGAGITGGILGFGISSLTQFSELFVPVMGFLSGTAFTAYDVYKEWQNNKINLEKNCMFFFYKAGKLLE